MCNDLEARCKAQDSELKNLRNRVRDLTHTDQVRDKAMMRTQREHSKVTKKVTEIESCLAKANAEKVRLRKKRQGEQDEGGGAGGGAAGTIGRREAGDS